MKASYEPLQTIASVQILNAAQLQHHVDLMRKYRDDLGTLPYLLEILLTVIQSTRVLSVDCGVFSYV